MFDLVAAAGVDEVACLIDFGPDRTEVAATLTQLAEAFLPGAGCAA